MKRDSNNWKEIMFERTELIDDGALRSFKEDVKRFFKRFQKNKTIFVNIGDPNDSIFIIRLNVIIEIANEFDFDIIGIEKTMQVENGFLAVFKNTKMGMGLQGIHLHISGEDDDEGEAMVLQEGEEDEASKNDDEIDENDDERLPIPIKRRKRPSPTPIPIYL